MQDSETCVVGALSMYLLFSGLLWFLCSDGSAFPSLSEESNVEGFSNLRTTSFSSIITSFITCLVTIDLAEVFVVLFCELRTRERQRACFFQQQDEDEGPPSTLYSWGVSSLILRFLQRIGVLENCDELVLVFLFIWVSFDYFIGASPFVKLLVATYEVLLPALSARAQQEFLRMSFLLAELARRGRKRKRRMSRRRWLQTVPPRRSLQRNIASFYKRLQLSPWVSSFVRLALTLSQVKSFSKPAYAAQHT